MSTAVVAANAVDDKVLVDEALRCALTNLLGGGLEDGGRGNVLTCPRETGNILCRWRFRGVSRSDAEERRTGLRCGTFATA